MPRPLPRGAANGYITGISDMVTRPSKDLAIEEER